MKAHRENGDWNREEFTMVDLSEGSFCHGDDSSFWLSGVLGFRFCFGLWTLMVQRGGPW